MILAVVASLAVGSVRDVQSDTRLQGKITIRAEAATAADLCRDLSEKTGVALAVDQKIREDLVVLFAKKQSAHEVFDLIGRHFDWEWQPQGNGYILRPSPKYAGIEATTFREHLWSQISTQVAQSREAARRPRSPRTSYRIFRQASEAWDRAYAKEHRTAEDEREIERLSDLIHRHKLDSNPFQHFSDVIFSTLTANDAVLMDGSRIVYSTRPKGYQRPFPPHVSPAIGALLVDLSSVFSEARALAKSSKPQDRWTPDDPSDDYDHLLPSGLEQWFEIGQIVEVRASVNDMAVHVTLLDATGRVLAGETCYPADRYEISPEVTEKLPSIDPELAKPLTHTRGLIEAAKKLENRWELKPKDAIAELVRDPTKHPLRRYARLVIMVAEASGHTVISDAYDPYLDGAHDLLRPTVEETFSRLADAMDQSCTFDAGSIRLKANAWGYYRRSQIPTSTYLAVAALDTHRDGYTVDDIAYASALVTPLQAESPFLTALTDVAWSRGRYYLYRAWNAIPAYQRAELRSGARYPIGAVPANARSMLEAWAFREGAPYTSRFGGCGMRSLTEYDEPDFQEPSGKYDPFNDFDSSEALPFRPEAVFAVRFANMPGLMVNYDNDEELYYQPPSTVASYIFGGGGLRVYRLAERDAHRFRVQLRDGLALSADCSGTSVGKETPLELAELPEALRARVVPYLNQLRERTAAAGGPKPDGPPPPL